MRLGWPPSTRAGLLGTGAMLLCPRAPIGSSPPRRRPRTRRGAGFGRSTFVGPPSRASPSSWGRSRACTDLAGRARAPAGASKTGPFDVYRIFTKVPGQREMPCDLRTKNPRREPESWMRSRCDRTPFARRSQCHITSVITFHTHTHKKPCTHAHHHVHLNRPLRTRKSHTRTETKKSRVRLPCRRRCIGDASAPARGQGTRPKLLGAKHAGFREQMMFVGMRAAPPPPKCYPSACWRRGDGTRSPTLSAPIRPHAPPRAAPASSRRAATSP
jgi:hypothetical protein